MTSIRSILSERFDESAFVSRGNAIMFAPTDESQALELVKLAIANEFRICPAGLMTHLLTDDFGDNTVIVSSKNLAAIVEYSPDDLYVTVGAGMMLRDINPHITARNLSFPLGDNDYPGTIGGGTSLGISAQFGEDIIPIKRYVPSLSFVTPYGKLIRAGAVTLKCVAGYDTPKLLVGSRGQFGFITSITLRLSHQTVGQDSLKPATIQSITPLWDEPDPSISPVERNLKTNLDPHRIFPSYHRISVQLEDR